MLASKIEDKYHIRHLFNLQEGCWERSKEKNLVLKTLILMSKINADAINIMYICSLYTDTLCIMFSKNSEKMYKQAIFIIWYRVINN